METCVNVWKCVSMYANVCQCMQMCVVMPATLSSKRAVCEGRLQRPKNLCRKRNRNRQRQPFIKRDPLPARGRRRGQMELDPRKKMQSLPTAAALHREEAPRQRPPLRIRQQNKTASARSANLHREEAPRKGSAAGRGRSLRSGSDGDARAVRPQRELHVVAVLEATLSKGVVFL